MIKKFNDYINEELKDATYQDAAKKFKELGGAHEQRGKKLLDWIDTVKKKNVIERSKQYGEYSMNYQVVSGTATWKNSTSGRVTEREFTEVFNKKYEYKKNHAGKDNIISSLREGPNKCYISAITCTDFEEEYPPEEIQYVKVIYINVFIIDIESGATTHAFNYEIPITWLEDDTFKVDGTIKIGIGFNEDESKILFSDRVSAVKFKKMMNRSNVIKLLSCDTGYTNTATGKKENYYDDVLRKFFMEYSTAEEMEKLFKLIESVPVNSLWD